MAKALIAVENTPSKFACIFLEADGERTKAGITLKNNYKQINKIKNLIGLGPLKKLGTMIGEEHNPVEDNQGEEQWCVAFRRDLNKTSNTKPLVESFRELLKEAKETDSSVIYLYKQKNDTWYYIEPKKDNNLVKKL